MWWKKFKVFPNLEDKKRREDKEHLENSTERSDSREHHSQVKMVEIESSLNHDRELSVLMKELENSRLAAKASECALVDLQFKFELAAKLSEVQATQATGLVKNEQIKSRRATLLAREKSNLKLSNQKLEFELAAVASNAISDTRIAGLIAEAEITIRKLKNTELANGLEVEKGDEQSRSAIFLANTARFVSEAMQNSELEAAIREGKKEGNARVEAEQLGSWISAQEAKKRSDGIVEKMKLQYEKATAAATNVSEQNMENLYFKTHLATHFARKQCESRLLSERAMSEVAAEVAEKYNAVILANQQHKYESAADAREIEFKSTMELQLEDSQTLIDAFNVEMVAKDLKYVVAKLTGERLEQQILTNRLEQKAESANKEREVLLSVCGNVAHDLNSPLLTLVLGTFF